MCKMLVLVGMVFFDINIGVFGFVVIKINVIVVEFLECII